jgi:2-keto-4-pentenoate hydratase/2-oxohepta-3-ene-1,7-dioic acid hydratase in catechol pathway
MRFASFHADGRNGYGFSPDGTRLYDLGTLLRQRMADEPVPNSLLEFIEAGPAVRQAAEASVREVGANPSAFPSHAVDAVKFLPPITRPSKICCLALNNSANVDRIMSGPKHPAMFIKAANTLTGHGTQIICKPRYGRVHPEPELAVVIGRLAKDVRASEAYDHVFGYTVHNDVTSPTMRTEDTFHYRAIHARNGNDREIEYVDTWVSYPGRYKGCDTFSCMGPWLVTRDDIPDPHCLAIECRQDGELITADNTANLFYKVPQVIEFLSGYMTLLPGDIISMGTALKASSNGGSAVQNINLAKSGTRVSVSIERIGTLENTSLLTD